MSLAAPRAFSGQFRRKRLDGLEYPGRRHLPSQLKLIEAGGQVDGRQVPKVDGAPSAARDRDAQKVLVCDVSRSRVRALRELRYDDFLDDGENSQNLSDERNATP